MEKARWHNTMTYKIKDSYIGFTLSETIMGCGIMQLYGLIGLTVYNIADATQTFKTICDNAKKDGVGSIICTLGESHYIHEQYILSLGFKLVSEYPNYRHSKEGKYKQRLYQIIL